VKAGPIGRRRWGALAALALAAALPAAAARGADETGPASDAPLVIDVGPTAQVIVVDPAERGMSGDPAEFLLACAVVPGCRGLWDGEIGTILILDYVPAPASPESGAAPSDVPGSTPR
jgi:hypothetical protein